MSRVYVGNLDPRVTERELEDEFRVYGVLQSVWVARKPPGYAFVNFDERRDAQDAIHALDVSLGRDASVVLKDGPSCFGLFIIQGKNGWRVELSHNSRGGSAGGGGGGGGGSRGGSRARDRSGGSDMKCYECGEPGHFARECRMRVGSRGQGSGRRRSPSPRYRRSPSYGRRSYSPRDRSPRSRSVSPSRGRRSYSKSPSRRGRDESPQLPRRGRDESPQLPRRGRDESPQLPRRGRDESPLLPRRSRDESPPHVNGNSAAKDRRRSRS